MPSSPPVSQVSQSMSQSGSLRQLVILGTGGTIAGTGEAPTSSRYRAAQLPVAALVAAHPGLLALANAGCLIHEQVAQIDSKDMSWSVWRALVERVQSYLAAPEVAGMVVTHGTDTLEETAYLLHRLVRANKPVVLTAAMRPATALDADGPRNLQDAVAVAQASGAQGVVAVVGSAVWAGAEVRKSHTWKLDAFDAGDAGALGWVHPGAELVMQRPWPEVADHHWPADLLAGDPPWVDVIESHAAAQAQAVDAWVHAGLQGLVVAGTGGGTVHAELETALARASAAGVWIWRSTRVARGGVLSREPQTPPGIAPLTPAQARIELMLRILGRQRGLAF